MHSFLKSPTLLSKSEIIHFSKIFRTNTYEILTTAASPDVDCERLLDVFKKNSTFSDVLQDSNGSFSYFSLKYTSETGSVFLIPLGVFGISAKHEMRFPLLLNDFWRDFLMIKKIDFCYLCNINVDQDLYYGRLLDLRRSFVEKVFNYYANIDGGYCSAMAWDLRSEKSLTRTLAESAKFSRAEFLRSEIYSSLELDNEKLNYLKKCLLSWFDIANSIKQNPAQSIPHNLPMIARGFVGL